MTKEEVVHVITIVSYGVFMGLAIAEHFGGLDIDAIYFKLSGLSFLAFLFWAIFLKVKK